MKHPVIQADFIVVGSGISGLTAALHLARSGTVALLTKKKLDDSATDLAQGGIAAALNKGDRPYLHYIDTLQAGDGLCRKQAVKILVEEGVLRVRELIEMGVPFDKRSEGQFDFTKEGVHSRRRILHAGDSTGHEIARILLKKLKSVKTIKIYEHTQALDLLIQDKKCHGIFAHQLQEGMFGFFTGRAVFLATGGIAQVYAQSSHPKVCTGDGIAMAYRAGLPLENMEFIQFHPTTLYTDKKNTEPLFLISEAVRGEGAILRNVLGEHFMPRYHPLADLAPRDVVARAILREMRKTLSDHVFLDFSSIKGSLTNRFPNIFQECKKAGFDLHKVLLPVAPAAHYLMGGIKADNFGQTGYADLYAIGETACMGVHGANRLASNSLLDGLVFGRRAAERAIQQKYKHKNDASPMRPQAVEQYFGEMAENYELLPKMTLNERERIRQLMWYKAGIIRRGIILKELLAELDDFNEYALDPETSNLLLTAKIVVRSALARRESRGAHYRLDYPHKKFWWRRGTVVRK
jgi:L-aspartate oxidase